MTKAEAVKHAVETATRTGAGRAVPRDVRERVVAYTTQRRAEGASWNAIAAETGLSSATLERWSGNRPRRASVPFRAVHLPPPASQGLVLVGACGVRIEGISVADAAELLRRLA
jgi:hypothetical protein